MGYSSVSVRGYPFARTSLLTGSWAQKIVSLYTEYTGYSSVSVRGYPFARTSLLTGSWAPKTFEEIFSASLAQRLSR